MPSSSATRNWNANGAPYNVGNAGIEALANGLAKEELPNNIRVNIVAPGVVETDMGHRLIKATQGAEDMRDLGCDVPFQACLPTAGRCEGCAVFSFVTKHLCHRRKNIRRRFGDACALSFVLRLYAAAGWQLHYSLLLNPPSCLLRFSV